jgi:hypothetical protein
MEQEKTSFDDNGSFTTFVPPYFKELVAEITSLARKSPEINQRSGVSVRVSISNYENMISNALRRAIRVGEKEVVPRVSDLLPRADQREDRVRNRGGRPQPEPHRKLIDKAVLSTFNRFFQVQQFDAFLSVSRPDGPSKSPRGCNPPSTSRGPGAFPYCRDAGTSGSPEEAGLRPSAAQVAWDWSLS